MPLIQRSSFYFVIGLLFAAGTAIATDDAWKVHIHANAGQIDTSAEPMLDLAPQRPLTPLERGAAERAWRFIEKNTRPETGLVDSVAGFPSTTLWDQGSYLMALVSARRLGVVSETEFVTRVQTFLDSFSSLDLFDNKLPNKAYDTRTLNMVNYQNEVSDRGIGWSALDVARMLLAFRTLERSAPQFGGDIRAVLARWDLSAMAEKGELIGTEVKSGETIYRQEGRLGYEQYGARAAALWGLDVTRAISAQRVLEWQEVANIEVPTDIRTVSNFQAISPIVSEPFLLQALELGLNSEMRHLAERVYLAQEKRYEASGVPTMVSEDHVDQDPFFLYASVISDGQPWAVLTESGQNYANLRTVSLKSVFGWDALFDTNYSNFLLKEVWSIGDADLGWPAGLYEKDMRVNNVYTLNTNSVVLEALHYIAHGPLWQTR